MRIPNVLVASAYGPIIVNFRDRYIGARIIEGGYARKGEIENLIKLDVEGMELRALQGGRQTIARDKPVLFLETVKSDQDAIAAFLGQQGYHGYAIKRTW